MEYRHAQVTVIPSVLTFALLASVQIIVAVAGAFVWWTLIFSIAILLLVMHFGRLVVTIGSGEIAAAFGSGWPVERIAFDEVIEARVVRNHWLEGFGIRKVRRGWMYNVWGLDAVELERSSGKVFRIGTDEPDMLKAAIDLHLVNR
ncbi:MAG: hypothetical protein R2823_08050 [Acidimicrobiia bacterium]